MASIPYEAALAEYRAGNREGAVSALVAAIACNSDDAAAWELLGVLRHSQGRLSDAIHALEVATSLKPLSLGGKLAIADSYVRSSLPEAALAVYEHLSTWERLVESGYAADVAVGLARLGAYSSALRVARAALEAEPENEEAAYAVSHFMFKCGYPAEAVLPVLERLVELVPSCVSYRIALATLHNELGQIESLNQTLSSIRVREIEQVRCTECLGRLAVMYASSGQFARARHCRRCAADSQGNCCGGER